MERLNLPACICIGIVEFSLPLSSEPVLGEWQVRARLKEVGRNFIDFLSTKFGNKFSDAILATMMYVGA